MWETNNEHFTCPFAFDFKFIKKYYFAFSVVHGCLAFYFRQFLDFTDSCKENTHVIYNITRWPRLASII